MTHADNAQATITGHVTHADDHWTNWEHEWTLEYISIQSQTDFVQIDDVNSSEGFFF